MIIKPSAGMGIAAIVIALLIALLALPIGVAIDCNFGGGCPH